MRTHAVSACLLASIAACYLPAGQPAPAYNGPPGAQAPAPQQGYDPNGYPAQGQPQPGYDPNGYPAQGQPQQGYDPNGYPAQGQPQQGYDPNGYPQGQPGYPAQAYAPQRECKSEYGTTVCGYHCVASYGQVQCADSPMGACVAEYGNITCWSPSPEVRQQYRDAGPAAQCVSQYGTSVCGYNCAAEYGEVRCAQTPSGVCQAAYGNVTCSN
jgi:hypothetical protein